MQGLKAGTFLLHGYAGVQSGPSARVSSDDHIRYTLRAALLTHVGERAFHPTMGSTIRDLLFRPLTNAVKTDLRREIGRTIEASEPRVELIDLDVTRDPADKSRLLVGLSYRHRESQKSGSFRLTISP